jgi:hypothetical protein
MADPGSELQIRKLTKYSTTEDLIRAINLLINGYTRIQQFVIWHNAPETEEIQEGTVVYADGDDWDPGGGRGLYEYARGAWVKLGPAESP